MMSIVCVVECGVCTVFRKLKCNPDNKFILTEVGAVFTCNDTTKKPIKSVKHTQNDKM
jgi:hypothetical protein